MKHPMLTIAAIQSASLPYDKAKIDYYLTLAKTRGAKLVVLGEYLLNLFFKELENTPSAMIEEQSRFQMESLTLLAKVYNLTILAPLVTVEKGKFYKSLVKFSPATKKIFHQQVLIHYEHWDEQTFFANPQTPLKAPPIFTVEGIKVAVLFGFETHFDPLWLECSRKKVDVVIVPTASTFQSQQRWRSLLQTRAFTHSLYVLRVNRIGEYQHEQATWSFYGDTFLMGPDGRIEDALGTKEEMLLSVICRDNVQHMRKEWGFSHVLESRGGLTHD